jgi:Transposase DDE domain
MAKKDPERSAEVARARAYARYTINLQRAFNDLLPKLKCAYGQPARDAVDERSQHVVALLAIAAFLEQVEPDYLAHFADQFAKLAQRLQLRTLAAAIKARWICEQAHQQMKEELGLDHFEGRSWQGLHRHALMTMIAYAFLQHRRLATVRREKKNQRAPAPRNTTSPRCVIARAAGP